MIISTRRLRCRPIGSSPPSSFVFETTGFSSPKPLVTNWTLLRPPSETNQSRTEIARFSESVWLYSFEPFESVWPSMRTSPREDSRIRLATVSREATADGLRLALSKSKRTSAASSIRTSFSFSVMILRSSIEWLRISVLYSRSIIEDLWSMGWRISFISSDYGSAAIITLIALISMNIIKPNISRQKEKK